MKSYLSVVAACAALTGCATITPSTARVEIQHISHATQHTPFTTHPTDYGVDIAGIVGRWEYRRAYIELGEGMVLQSCHGNACGGLYGPREVFTGRIGYEVKFK